MPASDYPSVLASLSQRRARQFSDVVDLLERSKEAGSVPSAEYNNAKLPFSRAVEESWDKLVRSPYLWNRDYVATDEERNAMREFSGAPAPHLMGSFRKRADALGNTASGVAARAFLAEISPAMDLMAHAKKIAVKRATKSPEKPLTEVYSAPAASGTAMAKVNEALTGVTEAARSHLARLISDGERRLLNRYLSARTESSTPGKPDLSPYDYSKRVGNGKSEPHVREPLNALTESFGIGGRSYRARLDHEEVLARRGDEAADLICADFVNRNLTKLASIVDAKGCFTGIKVIGRDVNPGGMEGRMRVSFDDGSSFEVRTSVVWSISIYGKPFARFPVTFHDVEGPDGSLTRKMSEKEMNEIFAAAENTADAEREDSPSP